MKLGSFGSALFYQEFDLRLISFFVLTVVIKIFVYILIVITFESEIWTLFF